MLSPRLFAWKLLVSFTSQPEWHEAKDVFPTSLLCTTIKALLLYTGALMHCWWKQGVSYKHILNIWPSNLTPKHLSKRNESMCPPKDLDTNVPSSFIYNCQKPETIQMSLNWWMDKQTGVRAYNGILLSNKHDTCNNMDKSQKHLWWIKEAKHKRLHILWFPL